MRYFSTTQSHVISIQTRMIPRPYNRATFSVNRNFLITSNKMYTQCLGLHRQVQRLRTERIFVAILLTRIRYYLENKMI